MTELKIPITREQFDNLKRRGLSKMQLPLELVRSLPTPIDFDRIRFSYRTRNLFRNFEGIDKDGSLHIGDRYIKERLICSDAD